MRECQHSKRRAFLVLLFFLFSCSSAPAWRYDSINTSLPPASTSQITYHPNSMCNAIGLRLTQDACGSHFFVENYNRPIPSLQGEPHRARFTLTIAEVSETIIADRFEGGQRLMLSQVASDKIIQSLLADTPIQITLGFTTADIPSEGFAAAYTKQMNPP